MHNFSSFGFFSYFGFFVCHFVLQVKSMAGGAGEAERGEFVREVAVLACLEVGGGGGGGGGGGEYDD